ncbi:hypothetical protein QJS10_CPB17g00104 [Acorus calamus]|uniref:Uncharacterized protein n=1 Tax=Acorus calamus TaxID=4465 RepID=A0AAV9CXJ2_ACOCL|nr:hypothetical protein QJS10_CPB17g00104 [Acorus calamus]
MPDLGNLLIPSSIPSLLSCDRIDGPADVDAVQSEVPGGEATAWLCRWDLRLRHSELHSSDRPGKNGIRIAVRKRSAGQGRPASGTNLAEHVKAWAEGKMDSGADKGECFLPFLDNAPRLVRLADRAYVSDWINSMQIPQAMSRSAFKTEIFRRLPLPYIEEEYNIESMWKDIMENNVEPTPYIHIRRSIL